MSAHRKLPPEEEAEIISWFAEYQAALAEVRRLGTVRQKAHEYGISTRGLRVIADRDGEKARRIIRECQGTGEEQS